MFVQGVQMFWMNDQEYIHFQGCCIWWITFMAFNVETQRSHGGVKNDITIVYLSWRRKSHVVEKWTSKNHLCQKLFGDASF